MIVGVDIGARRVHLSFWGQSLEGLSAIDLDAPKLRHQYMATKTSPRGEQLLALGDWFHSEIMLLLKSPHVLGPDEPVTLFVEEPVVGRNAKAALSLAETRGVLLMAAAELDENYEKDITAYDVNNKGWKKEIVGNGNASKDLVSSWLELNHPEYHQRCGGQQDYIDAVCIGLYGVATVAKAAALRPQ